MKHSICHVPYEVKGRMHGVLEDFNLPRYSYILYHDKNERHSMTIVCNKYPSMKKSCNQINGYNKEISKDSRKVDGGITKIHPWVVVNQRMFR